VFDLQFRRESTGWVLRILLDVPYENWAPTGGTEASQPDEAGRAAPSGGGVVTIQDCERVSRDVSAILDVEETIDHRYVLEVSSPGLDRPLRGPADYRRFAGRLAKLVVSEAVNGQTHFEGHLQGLEGDAVIVETAPGKRHLIPLRLISRARLEVEF
jgi:ribosome maturation factor RimP